MSQIVPEGDGLGEVLVQAKRGGHAAGNLRNLKRVREPRAVVVPLGSEKHLRLVREAPEGLAVDDAVPVALVACAKRIGLLGHEPADGGIRERRERREQLVLPPLDVCPCEYGKARTHALRALDLRDDVGGELLDRLLVAEQARAPKLVHDL